MILKVKTFSVVDHLKLKVVFNNDEVRVVDLSTELDGEIFEALKDPDFFRQVRLTEWHVIEWPNGADFAPEFLFEKGRKAS